MGAVPDDHATNTDDSSPLVRAHVPQQRLLALQVRPSDDYAMPPMFRTSIVQRPLDSYHRSHVNDPAFLRPLSEQRQERLCHGKDAPHVDVQKLPVQDKEQHTNATQPVSGVEQERGAWQLADICGEWIPLHANYHELAVAPHAMLLWKQNGMC